MTTRIRMKMRMKLMISYHSQNVTHTLLYYPTAEIPLQALGVSQRLQRRPTRSPFAYVIFFLLRTRKLERRFSVCQLLIKTVQIIIIMQFSSGSWVETRSVVKYSIRRKEFYFHASTVPHDFSCGFKRSLAYDRKSFINWWQKIKISLLVTNYFSPVPKQVSVSGNLANFHLAVRVI